jgi:hypothetical protein
MPLIPAFCAALGVMVVGRTPAATASTTANAPTLTPATPSTKVNIFSLLAAANSDYIACVTLFENRIPDSPTHFLSSVCPAFLPG